MAGRLTLPVVTPIGALASPLPRGGSILTGLASTRVSGRFRPPSLTGGTTTLASVGLVPPGFALARAAVSSGRDRRGLPCPEPLLSSVSGSRSLASIAVLAAL